MFACVLCVAGCGDIVVEEMEEKHCNNLWDFLDEPNQVVSLSHMNYKMDYNMHQCILRW